MNSGWHREDIIAAVRKKGSTLRRLGREHGFAKFTVNNCLTKRFPNAHEVVAAYLGVSRGEIWPQWYDATGKPTFNQRADVQLRFKQMRKPL